ncbi:MAG: hypothetical protein U0989_00515 [Azonexus sp.]|nr:hypothetical protein [Azonexus sp.]MDZ4313253.1 hypothetical protein [Azonexus sp.]
MKIAAVALVLSIAALPSFAADEGSAALIAIGEINGIALACQQPAIVSRARNAVTSSAPKTRANGEIFENATNSAYLAQGKGQACPDVPTLVKRLADAEKNLSTAFATK